MFTVRYDRSWHFFEVIFFIFIGVFGGLYGAFVIKWNLRAQAFRKKYLADYAILEATLLAAGTALLCYPNMFLRIDMTESMEILFLECEGGHDYAGLCECVCHNVSRLYSAGTDCHQGPRIAGQWSSPSFSQLLCEPVSLLFPTAAKSLPVSSFPPWQLGLHLVEWSASSSKRSTNPFPTPAFLHPVNLISHASLPGLMHSSAPVQLSAESCTSRFPSSSSCLN